MNPQSSAPSINRKGSSDETAPPWSDPRSSSADTSKTHRPILLSAADVARADGDAGFVDLNSPVAPPLLSFAIEESHPLIDSWPLIRAQIMTVLDQSKIKWTSLGVLRRRQVRKQGADDTTVVLVVKKGNRSEVVESVEEDIYHVCKITGNPGLFVEILKGEITRYNGSEFNLKPSGGSSLSPTEVDCSTGTLGGYVRLAGPNGSQVFAVSCHHVTMPTSPDTPDEYPEAVELGLGHHICISQPSVMAHEEYVSAQHKVCETFERQVYRLQEETKAKPGTARRELEITENVLRTVRNDLQKALDFNRHFGALFATSGYRISKRIGCALDWALVHVQDTRLGENRVLELPQKPRGYELLSAGNAIVDVAPLSVDDNVTKFGYETGTTYGRVSHIKHDCNLQENSSFTSEYVVVGHRGRQFASKGDSGAFVLNGHGKLAGLLIAGQKELGTVYVTPIMEVMQDIEEVTGREVTLPKSVVS